MIVVVVNTVIFLSLSILHFYWAFGGKVWYDEVLPTSSNRLNRLNPGRTAGLMVATGLLLLAAITFGNGGFFNRYIKRTYFRYGALMIAVIFSLRAIGDFKFIGFFKTVRQTRFGVNDTQLFSPLCLLIALLSILIFILTNNKRLHPKGNQ
jgi:hypothetical protein